MIKINEHEANRLNYHKADYDKMNLLCKMTQWSVLFKHEPSQNMWSIFTTNYDNIVPIVHSNIYIYSIYIVPIYSEIYQNNKDKETLVTC